MLEYDGLRTMREMQIQSGQIPTHIPSLHEQMGDTEKTKPDGSPVDMLDLLFDKRYAEREHDSEYYESDYYYSEEESSSSSDEEEPEDEYDEEEDEESKVAQTDVESVANSQQT